MAFRDFGSRTASLNAETTSSTGQWSYVVPLKTNMPRFASAISASWTLSMNLSASPGSMYSWMIEFARSLAAFSNGTSWLSPNSKERHLRMDFAVSATFGRWICFAARPTDMRNALPGTTLHRRFHPRLRALLLPYRRKPSCFHKSHNITSRVTMSLCPVLGLCKVEQKTDERNV